MEQLISNIYSKIQDYRKDENNPDFLITIERIKKWILQFSEKERIPVLEELDNIFKLRYCSKEDAKGFLDNLLITLKDSLKFNTIEDLLKNTQFLDLQEHGKSQSVMLNLFNELIHNKFNLSLNDCGAESKKYSIYIDDFLCTGLTMYNNIMEWQQHKFDDKKTNKEAIEDKSTTLILTYIFTHNKNYRKKLSQMKVTISKLFADNIKLYRCANIENSFDETSKLDLILPLNSDDNPVILDYKNTIIGQVDKYTKPRISVDEFYRGQTSPKKESFFTNSDNRKLIENIFLIKGIEILNHSNVTKENIRALGYSLPSFKDFGFGTLCFAWRNIPNNTPLVFWYSSSYFMPLFVAF
jgi:hypothetical protein